MEIHSLLKRHAKLLSSERRVELNNSVNSINCKNRPSKLEDYADIAAKDIYLPQEFRSPPTLRNLKNPFARPGINKNSIFEATE
jgi:hypothetical protein